MPEPQSSIDEVTPAWGTLPVEQYLIVSPGLGQCLIAGMLSLTTDRLSATGIMRQALPI